MPTIRSSTSIDLYLSEGEASFSPTPFHEKRHQFFGGDVPFPPYKIEPPQTVLTKEQLLDYADDCRKKAGRVIEGLDEAKLRADAPFEWLPMPTAELML